MVTHGITYNDPSRITLSHTTASGVLIFAYYLGCFICVPVFADGIGKTQPVDKIAAALLLPMAFLGFRRSLKTTKSLSYYVLGYFASLILSSLVQLSRQHTSVYPILAPLVGVVLDGKPFVFIYAFYEILSRKQCDLTRAILIAMHVIVGLALFNSVFALRDILLGGESVWGIPLSAGMFGFSLPVGLFNHKVLCACLTMMGALSCLGLMRNRITPLRSLIFVYLLVLSVFNGSLKETLAVIVGAVFFALFSSKRGNAEQMKSRFLTKFVTVLLVCSSIAAVSSLLSKRYRDYGGRAEATVRGALYLASFSIAKDEFPLGSGSGTFATKPSRDISYSPLYYKYGIFAMKGGEPGKSAFILDVWWPHVIAESGFIGMLLYFGIVLYAPTKLFKMLRDDGGGHFLFLFASAVAVGINSVAAPTLNLDVFQPVIGIAWGAAMAVGRRGSGSTEEKNGYEVWATTERVAATS